MVIPVSSLKTLRNADIRRVDMQTLTEQYFRVKPIKEYERLFYSYDVKGKTYADIVEFFTSPEASMGKFGRNNQIQLCLSRAYCNGKLVGLDFANVYYSKRDNGGVRIFVDLQPGIYHSSLDSIHSYCLNDGLYEIINGRVINLSFDKDSKVRYTKKYLNGNFKPIDIQVLRPYGRFERYSWNGYAYTDNETLLSYADADRMLKWIKQIDNVNLAPYLKGIISDFSFREDSSLLRWKSNVE